MEEGKTKFKLKLSFIIAVMWKKKFFFMTFSLIFALPLKKCFKTKIFRLQPPQAVFKLKED